jgi:hypothetical protein
VPGEVGGPRHYDGRTPSVGPWQCKSCGQQQGGDPAYGCQSCGVGTAAQAEQAAALARQGTQVPHARVAQAAVLPLYNESEIALPAFHLFQLTPAARWSIAAALAHYADHGSPTTAELPRVVTKAWALELSAQLLEEEAGTATVVNDPAPTKGPGA